MKSNRLISVIGFILSVVLSLGFHLIRTDEGFDLITKEVLSFEETYADVRDWKTSDFLTCAPRIRNHLLSIRYQDMVDAAEGHAQGLKARVRDAEQSLHEWVSEKLE